MSPENEDLLIAIGLQEAAKRFLPYETLGKPYEQGVNAQRRWDAYWEKFKADACQLGYYQQRIKTLNYELINSRP